MNSSIMNIPYEEEEIAMKYLLESEHSERLYFRLLKEEDFDTWKKLFSTKNIARFLCMNEKLSEFELCKQWFKRVFERYEKGKGGMNVLICKDTKKMIGQCGLLVQNVEGLERLEIGYSILPEYWNMGFATEASQTCKNYAFKNNFSTSLISLVHEKNTTSAKVAIKNGMYIEKKLKNYNGHPFSMFSINKNTWEKNFK